MLPSDVPLWSDWHPSSLSCGLLCSHPGTIIIQHSCSSKQSENRYFYLIFTNSQWPSLFTEGPYRVDPFGSRLHTSWSEWLLFAVVLVRFPPWRSLLPEFELVVGCRGMLYICLSFIGGWLLVVGAGQVIKEDDFYLIDLELKIRILEAQKLEIFVGFLQDG